MSTEDAKAGRTPLFRAEAVQAVTPQQAGEIVLVPGVSSRWIALAALVVLVALALLLSLGTYTRRSTVNGQLYPSEGLIRVTAVQPGVVVERHVRDGQLVERGMVLFVLTGDRAGPDAMAYQRGIALQIEARRRSLQEDLRRSAVAERLEEEQLRRRVSSLGAELEQVGRQANQILLRVKGAEDASRRYASLFEKNYVSRDELLAKEGDLNELRGRLEGSRRDALVLGRDLGGAQRELQTLPNRYASQRAELERAILLTQQEFTEIEARRRVVVSAPADGQVTLLQAEIGQSVEMGRALAHLVPASTALVARLYAPSRAAGFVRPGEPVLLRFDTFPYQRFGQCTGKVLSVSTAAATGVDIPGFVPGPELAGQPLFEIAVTLPAQWVSNAGQHLPLQSGMRVEADLLHETRPLYEWVLEPLYSARSRITNS
jgi:membrane fusion protein